MHMQKALWQKKPVNKPFFALLIVVHSWLAESYKTNK